MNRLLACLPEADHERLFPNLELVHLDLGSVVYEAGVVMSNVYFPVDSIVSLLYVMKDGDSAEIAIVGNEGMVGISMFMDGGTTTSRAVVQNAGNAFVLNARLLEQEFKRGGALQHLLLRFTQALITQMMQTGACNRHHSVDQQLCRWLLMSLDRMPSNRLMMTQGLIANMLGIRFDGVTDSAGRLEAAGLIRYDDGTITMLDRPGLECHACECYSVVKQEYERLLPTRPRCELPTIQSNDSTPATIASPPPRGWTRDPPSRASVVTSPPSTVPLHSGRIRVHELTLDESQTAVLQLGRWLRMSNYRFTTVTPETQRRVNARPGQDEARNLRDIFGWNRPFDADLLPADALRHLESAGALQRDGNLLRSGLRFSSVDDYLFAHSAYPTTAPDSVFFGPDTLRFVDVIRRMYATSPFPVRNIVDIGCGSGAGGLIAAGLIFPSNPRLILSDINSQALRMAAVNAALNGVDAGSGSIEYVHGDLLDSVTGPIDLVIANPPYLADPGRRLYRDGGDIAGAIGGALSVRIVEESMRRLSPGGRLVLYTGSAIVAGEDLLYKAIEPLLTNCRFRYTEIDADVFGEELDAAAYASVERIAAVSLVATLLQGGSP